MDLSFAGAMLARWLHDVHRKMLALFLVVGKVGGAGKGKWRGWSKWGWEILKGMFGNSGVQVSQENVWERDERGCRLRALRP